MADKTSRLEPFLILARSTKGAAAAKVILDVTAAPGIYVFSELLEMPNIQEDYEDNKAILPSLMDAHINKLRQLTLLSLASQHRLIYISQRCQTAQTLLGALDTEITHLRQGTANEASELAAYRFHRDEAYETVANELRNEKVEKSAKRGTEAGAEFNTQQWSAHGRGYEEQAGPAMGAGATFGGKAGQNILQSLAQVGNLGGAFSGRNNLVRNVSGQSDELENYRAFKRSKD
ncbi:hypothetical protein I307_05983 [Cryptococcus deuterogattii 99/473]|uniref:Uncharacterized protein n=1 Tax=Cryptococcus deuterogattii Ram5 TaxID=1296110 RepID=A0A0D0T6X7_9TREE|nr:hypothetical protein I313_02746 [Cryptococcus deuterogattii Ram5]KIY54702.1 hypothetical protein I307_05983 [Cryptococcus deuterogattii 99/473]